MGGSSGFQQSALTGQPTYNYKLLLLLYITRVGGAGCTILPALPSLSTQGYCGFMFTVHDRLLVPANPNIGVLHHRGKYYAFSSKEAADGFAGNPDG